MEGGGQLWAEKLTGLERCRAEAHDEREEGKEKQ